MTDEIETDPPHVEEVVTPPADAVEEVVPHPDSPPDAPHVHDHLCPECIANVVAAIGEASPVPEVEEALDPDETPGKLPWTHRNPFGK